MEMPPRMLQLAQSHDSQFLNAKIFLIAATSLFRGAEYAGPRPQGQLRAGLERADRG
jgi:hypothetical protein